MTVRLHHTQLCTAGWLCVLCAIWLAGCTHDQPLEAVGLLEWDRLELVAETNEPITDIVRHEGDMLAAGDVILQQDSRRIQAQLEEATAQLSQAQARLAELKRGPRTERIDEARAMLQGAISEAENTQKELARSRVLLTQKLISPEAVDTAQTRLNKAVAEKNAAHAALEALLHGSTVEELQQAEAAVAQAEAGQRALQVTLDNLSLRAPRAGRLDTLPYERGERPPAGAVVAVLLAENTPYARVYVPEPMRAQVRQGTNADVYIDGLDGPVAGKVRMISSDAMFTPYYSLTERDRSRLSYLAEIDLQSGTGHELPSGVPVRVIFRPEPDKTSK